MDQRFFVLDFNFSYKLRSQCDDKNDRSQMKIYFHRAGFELQLLHLECLEWNSHVLANLSTQSGKFKQMSVLTVKLDTCTKSSQSNQSRSQSTMLLTNCSSAKHRLTCPLSRCGDKQQMIKGNSISVLDNLIKQQPIRAWREAVCIMMHVRGVCLAFN